MCALETHPRGGPALTPASVLPCTQHITLVEMGVNTVAQLVGSTLGAGLLYLAVGSISDGCNGVPHFMTAGQAFLVEFILTFGLCFTVSSLFLSPLSSFAIYTVFRRKQRHLFSPRVSRQVMGSVDTRNKEYNVVGPLKIGFSVVTAHLVAVPLTGCGINPARSFATAFVSGGKCWNNHWVFWLAPCLAGLIAPMLYYNFSPFFTQWDTIQAHAAARAAKKARKAGQHVEMDIQDASA
jgi:glycerol uptake facilitator-like aquaporin